MMQITSPETCSNIVLYALLGQDRQAVRSALNVFNCKYTLNISNREDKSCLEPSSIIKTSNSFHSCLAKHSKERANCPFLLYVLIIKDNLGEPENLGFQSPNLR